ncbi:MAG TPA: KH domain-containing protein [Acidimicrobiales bacterium]|nr:KH domain-containing protein [Acidimicrobiales bacterium]
MTDEMPASPAFEQPDFSSFEEAADGEDLDIQSDEYLPDEGVLPAANARPAASRAERVLDHLARSIVDDKDAVVIEARESRGQLRLDLHVAPPDMGRIIGRRGRTAQALRTLVRAAAAADGRDAFVDIVDG